MPHIRELWTSQDERKWGEALDSYWTVPSVVKNRELEMRFNHLDSAAIRVLSQRDWYDFLKDEYFVWKYTAKNRLASSRKHLRQYEAGNELQELFAIKEQLFSFDLKDIRRGLAIAKGIKGLGYAGGSGLLSVLFPKWFGTADQFVARALWELELMPERQTLLKIRPEDLKEPDAVLLVDIMRRKASELNALFHTDAWTPRKIDMVLWATRSSVTPDSNVVGLPVAKSLHL